MNSTLPFLISSGPASAREGRTARQSRARYAGKCVGGVGSTHLSRGPRPLALDGYITCDDHMGVIVRVPASHMQQGDAQVICERERGRA